MRLSLPSVAILSLFAATSHAFAPPTSTASIATSTRLNAGNELSGLLSEYSDAAATASDAADKAVEKVAEVASSAVVTPPPLPPPETPSIGDVADSAIDSVMKAASAAQDAADQAAAAAAAAAASKATAAKATAAKAAAAKATADKAAAAKAAAAKAAAAKAAAAKAASASVAGASVAGGVQLKPLVGGIFVPVDPSKINTDNQFDASARAQENLAILKANFVGSFGSGAGDASTAASSLKSFDVNMPSVGSVDLSPAIAEIIASLHLKEYGGWYAAAAMAIIASQQRTAGKEDASSEFESELTSAREKASEAASAAGLAAEGAKTAKKLAMKMEKDSKKGAGDALLESSRSKMAQMEKDLMEKEMRALQAEVASLRTQLANAQGATKKTPTKKKTVKTEIEEAYPTKVVMEGDPDTDSRIIELLKAMDEENAIQRNKAAAELEKKREQEAKFVAAEKSKAESRKMTKGVEAAQAKAEVALKKKATKKKAKKAATKSEAKAKTKAAPKKSATVKAAAKKAPKAVASGAVDDWASLAQSTLKRKTVAQLSEYLTEKGVTVLDGAGKSLKKAELLAAVKSL